MLLMVGHGVRSIANATQVVPFLAAGTFSNSLTASLEGEIETDRCSIRSGGRTSSIPNLFRNSLLKLGFGFSLALGRVRAVSGLALLSSFGG